MSERFPPALQHPKKQRRRHPKSDADPHFQASGYEIPFREPMQHFGLAR
jgi:hypothetical protein